MITTFLAMSSALATDLAVRGAEVRTVSGETIADAVVLVEDGRITAVGPAADVPIPEGTPVIEGAVVTPGLVDGLGTVGLTGILNTPQDQDHRESHSPVQPELRALDGFDPWEELVAWARDHGVTTLHVGPSPGPVVAGRTLLTPSLPGADLAGDAYAADSMVVFSLGETAKRNTQERKVQSRMGAAAIMRQALAEAGDYASRRRLGLADRPAVDLGTEALVDLLRGRRKALVHAHRADDLLTALRIAEEFSIDVVLAGATEGYLVRQALADAGVDVLVGPIMLRGWRNDEQANASFRNAGLMADAGVRVGIMTGYEGYVPKVRVAVWEAAIAAAHGLGPERALRALTLDTAAILGIERTVGSLQVGKRADLVVFDGDPFEYTSHVCAVVVGGRVASQTCR